MCVSEVGAYLKRFTKTRLFLCEVIDLQSNRTQRTPIVLIN